MLRIEFKKVAMQIKKSLLINKFKPAFFVCIEFKKLTKQR